jgi:hypothetical protein
MASTRTQIYLTAEQRKRLDARVRRDGKTLAQVIRDAVDQYLEGDRIDPEEALKATFGASPDLAVPDRQDWDRGYG